MIAHQFTRRTVLGTGLAFASMTGAFSAGTKGQTTGSADERQRINAMLVDSSVGMPPPIEAFVGARRKSMPVVDIHLDALGHAQLKRIFRDSRAIIGISSGATLFCLERIAWDHGFRLTRRNQRSACDFNSEACVQDILEFLNGAYPAAMRSKPSTYRPSRADAMLHAWTMQKSASSPFSLDRREA